MYLLNAGLTSKPFWFLCGLNSFQNQNTYQHNFILIINDSCYLNIAYLKIEYFNNCEYYWNNCEYCNISKSNFFSRTPLVAASQLKSNIRNAYPDKNEMKLFL